MKGQGSKSERKNKKIREKTLLWLMAGTHGLETSIKSGSH